MAHRQFTHAYPFSTPPPPSGGIIGSTWPTTRNKLLWPFSPTSIWNQSIGSGAVYHPMNLNPLANTVADHGYWHDNIHLILSPGSPQKILYESQVAKDLGANIFQQSLDWCVASTVVLKTGVPIPAAFADLNDVTAGQIKGNNNGAVLLQDGDTMTNVACLATCYAGANPTGAYLVDSLSNQPSDNSIQGNGRMGGHGATRLNTMGGTVRISDITAPEIRHALAITCQTSLLWKGALYKSPWVTDVVGYDDTYAFTWPAYTADGNAPTKYSGTDRFVKMGSLCAIPASTNLATLGFETVPGLIFAQNAQDYGWYLVETSPWDPANPSSIWDFNWETSPDPVTGLKVTSQAKFQSVYGWDPFQTTFHPTTTTPAALRSQAGNPGKWVRDLDRILSHLAIVTNNAPGSIGGGGTARKPDAPPFA